MDDDDDYVLHLNVNVATCFNLFKFPPPPKLFEFWADMWVHSFLNFEFEAVTSKQTVINY